MTHAILLRNDDICPRRAWYSLRWQAPLVSPASALYSAIEAGVLADNDAPWDTAENALLDIATERGLDSPQTDLLGEAEHLASLASFITYLLRPEGIWKRPEPVPMPDGSIWTPASFLDASESHLRRIVLCSRWDAYRQVQEEHDWRTMESAVYGVPIDLIVVVIGQERNGRRNGPLSKGWTHPVSKQLRFKKRDGTAFDGNWEQVFREKSDFGKEAWLDSLVDDGVLAETIHVHHCPVPERRGAILHLLQSKLARIRAAGEPPEENLTACFDRIHPCPFRGACPRGEEPGPDTGFVPIARSLLR